MNQNLSRRLIYSVASVDANTDNFWLERAVALLKEGESAKAYQLLLAYDSDCSDAVKADSLWLQLQCLDFLRYNLPVSKLIKRLSFFVPPDDWRVLHGTLQFLLKRRLKVRLNDIVPGNVRDQYLREFPHLLITAIELLIQDHNITDAESLFDNLVPSNSVLYVLIKARLATANNNYSLAEAILLPGFDTYIYSLDYCELLIDVLFQLRRENLCVPVLRRVLNHHQSNSSLSLSRFAEAKLLQRQPAPGLRFKLLERLNSSVTNGVDQQAPTCLSTAYDLLGRSDWFDHIHPELIQRPGMATNFSINLMMHFSSHALSSYSLLASNLVSHLYQQWKSIGEDCIGPSAVNKDSTKLKIGWICGDIANHPVFRFVYSWFYASQCQKTHCHQLVATHPMQDDYAQMILSLTDVDLIDLSHYNEMPDFLDAIRRENFDIVIDLNGWTANNLAPVFLARVAPLQINYLAYHASTGLPSIDVWLVDQHLLPSDTSTQEWHTERIVSLKRPFLAWQPPPNLPEGRTKDVAPLAFDPASSIRFGCFNNTRKISLQCLQLWSKLLNEVPDARLVLKAFASEDSDSEQLIKRRLTRSGIDLNRIEFLSFTSTPDEHLQQYGHMDIALDSFPNSGCTTTCEALWMGVPVLALRGSHYVSRMAYSVLCAAGLENWTFADPSNFLKFAVNQAQKGNLKWLRENRPFWRHKILSSPLGDANDLMAHLERIFSELYQEKLRSVHNNASK